MVCRCYRKRAISLSLIRDFSDHATFKDKGAKLACADKLGVFLSLTLCNKANFDTLPVVEYDGLEKMLNRKKMYRLSSFSWYKSLNDACTAYILKVLLKIKSLLLFLAKGRAF